MYETRKVVEEYVLYKIKEYITASQCHSRTIENGENGGANNMQDYPNFPHPQAPPNRINQAVRTVAYDFEDMYRRKYPDLLEKIRALHIATWDVDRVFTIITKDVFKVKYGHGNEASTSGSTVARSKTRTPSPHLHGSDKTNHSYTIDDSDVKWGHVIALLVFSGLLAVRCVEISRFQQVDEIINWVTKFLDTKLRVWLTCNGSWEGFLLWYEQSRGSTVNNWFDEQQMRSRIANALRISGAVAAVALGAIVLTRK